MRKNVLRRKAFAEGIGDLFQTDLVDMAGYSNAGARYWPILTCIGVFSKMAFAVPLEDKRGSSEAEALETEEDDIC